MSREPALSALDLVTHAEQYIGVWAMHEPAVAEMVHRLSVMNVSAHIGAEMGALQARLQASGDPVARPLDKREERYESLEGGIALIDLVGMMTKYGSWFSELREGTVGVRRAVRQAAADEQIKAILLRIDSPGGTSAGTDDLADDVRRAAEKKPFTAYIEDLGASAAYYVASQARSVSVNPGAIVGAIGVYTVVYDYSSMAADEGIKVHVIRAGEFKGAGTPGTQVTDEQLAEFQRVIDQINDLFVGAVAIGRRMDTKQVRELADGRVHVGLHAKALGLVDTVQTLDEAIDSLREKSSPRTSRDATRAVAAIPKETPMSQETETKSDSNTAVDQPMTVLETQGAKPATLAELKREFPAGDAAFREECIELEATMSDAKDLWITRLQKQQATANAKIAEMDAQSKRPGVEPLRAEGGAGGEEASGDPIQAFNKLLAEKVQAGKSKQAAVSEINREAPELIEAYRAACNAQHGRKA